MTPDGFRLYDLLDLCAVAIGEAEAGRGEIAAYAWGKARASASALFEPGTAAERAAGVILLASRPDQAAAARALLWNALDAASAAALAAMEGRRHGEEWVTAFSLASHLEPGASAALLGLLADARRTVKAREVPA